MRTTGVFFVCGLALLAACSKSPSGQASAPGASAPVAAALPFSRPHPRVGLWQMNISTDAGPGVQVTGDICIDASTEASAFQASPRARSSNCSEPHFSPNPGGGVAFDATCKVNERTISSRGVATGDFSSAYVVDVTTRMDPPLPGGVSEGHSRIEAHWAGPCKPGQRPGQMTGIRLAGVGRG
jgi:hypothetical protein